MADDETVVEAFATGLRLGRASRVARIGERAVDATAKTEIDRARRDLGHARDLAFRADLRAALGLTEASNDYDIVVAARSAMGLAEARVRESDNLRPVDDAPPAATALNKLCQILPVEPLEPDLWQAVLDRVALLKHQVDEDKRRIADLTDHRRELLVAQRELAKEIAKVQSQAETISSGPHGWAAVVAAARDLVGAIKGTVKMPRHDAEMALYRAVTALDPAPTPEQAP